MMYERYRKGYRYIREYRTQGGNVRNWALWEYNGERRVRVGTARTEEEYEAFLWHREPAPAD